MDQSLLARAAVEILQPGQAISRNSFLDLNPYGSLYRSQTNALCRVQGMPSGIQKEGSCNRSHHDGSMMGAWHRPCMVDGLGVISHHLDDRVKVESSRDTLHCITRGYYENMVMETSLEKKKKKRKKSSVDAVHPDTVDQCSDRGTTAEEKFDAKKKKKRADEKEKKAVLLKGQDGSDGSTKPLTNWERLKGTLKSSKKKRSTAEDGMVINITMDKCASEDVRGHLTKILALDCEMVGGGVGGQLSLLARVSIVNASGDVVYDTFVSPTERITDYRTQWSGIRPKDLIGAPTKQSVVEKVKSILAGRILVGHALQNDLEALNISHPESHVRDSSRYPEFMRKLICGKLKPKALRHIVAEELDMTIQTGEHDSIQDARAVLGLYQKHKSSWEVWHSKEMKRLKKRRKKNST